MKQEPFFARSLTLVPRSLLLNRTETLATQAKEAVKIFTGWKEVRNQRRSLQTIDLKLKNIL